MNNFGLCFLLLLLFKNIFQKRLLFSCVSDSSYRFCLSRPVFYRIVQNYACNNYLVMEEVYLVVDISLMRSMVIHENHSCGNTCENWDLALGR